ncbi:copper chaperone CopZ [Clostridium botulinum CFSAN002369]|nr:copper chaperone CopZ [Clostridium botulinum CFSAN002369]
MKMKASIEGMSCMHCVNHVKEALSELKGISNINVSLEGNLQSLIVLVRLAKMI